MNLVSKASTRLLCFCILGMLIPTAVNASSAAQTSWKVYSAEGIDALLLIGAASGDVMQSDIYRDEIKFVRENMSQEGLQALKSIDQTLRSRLGKLSGPTLALFFSANSVASIDDVIASAADPVSRLRPGLEQSAYWQPEEFEGALRLMPAVHTALVSLKEMGFEAWYEETQKENINAAIKDNLVAVSSYDIIPEQSRLLGRELEPTIDILVVAFARPYGIRILGQRFIAWYGWEGATQLRIAAHEIFHPPYDLADEELNQLLGDLENDPWMQSIVNDHDPQYGYNSFRGIVNEDSAQALDQIVSERMGFARDAGMRWTHSDGGMHLLAAALYHAMKADGFADTGGVYSNWLKSALRRGLLSPELVRRRAAEVVGQGAVDSWGMTRKEKSDHP